MYANVARLMVLGLLAAMAPLQAVAQQQAPPPDLYWPGPWQFWWICPVMMLFMLAVFGIAVRRSSAEGPHHWGPPWRIMGSDPTQSALQILNQRFARGEIQREEYDQRRTTILSAGSR